MVPWVLINETWYYSLTGVEHGLCNAHHLRELKALIGIEGETWARTMSDLLLAASAAVQATRRAGGAALPDAELRRIFEQYDAIVAEGMALHEQQPPLGRAPGARRGAAPRRPGHNLLLRRWLRKSDVLRFATNQAVPFTSNQAEQDLRMMKVKMKISGGFRTEDGQTPSPLCARSSQLPENTDSTSSRHSQNHPKTSSSR